tara:strand:+ start:383 stop:865 length:483 start_codon:yes stop_codon:yes gene_type:complete
MSFPYVNAKTVNSMVVGKSHSTIIAKMQITSGNYNLFSVPGVVDVSAMEFSIGMQWAANAARGKSASGNAGYDVGVVDGGTTGDLTGRGALFTSLNGSVGTNITQFASTIPFDVAGSSATDLDADDWVNMLHLTSSTQGASFGVATCSAGYIYGKPAGIN